MFGWFRKRMAAATLQPEARWIVTLADDEVHVTDPTAAVTTLHLSDLAGVAIETNDSGPWGADVWWLLFGPDDRIAVAFPQGATGEQAVVDCLMGLPMFDLARMTDAMRSTGNAVFPVWEP